jgi:hypothetical protein
MAGKQFVKQHRRGPGGTLTLNEGQGFDRLPRRGGFRAATS